MMDTIMMNVLQEQADHRLEVVRSSIITFHSSNRLWEHLNGWKCDVRDQRLQIFFFFCSSSFLMPCFNFVYYV